MRAERNQRLVVSEECERTAFKKVTLMEKRRVDSLEFPIKSGVTLLGRRKRREAAKLPALAAGGPRQCENQRHLWLRRQEQWGRDERGEWQRPVQTSCSETLSAWAVSREENEDWRPECQ